MTTDVKYLGNERLVERDDEEALNELRKRGWSERQVENRLLEKPAPERRRGG